MVVGALKHATMRAVTSELAAGLVASLVRAVGYVVIALAALPLIGVDTSTVGLGLSAILAFVIGFGLQDTWAKYGGGDMARYDEALQ